MNFILALDQGTTSSRAIVYDREGCIRGVAQREFQQFYPQPGQVEHDPEEIWASQISVAVEALSRAHAVPGDVAALGITNQRETTVVWDRKTGKPVSNAIVWQDRRTAPLCERLIADGKEELIRAKTGLLLDPYFAATKIAWILEHVACARQKAEAGELAFGTVDSWLIWNLTNGAVHATDASNASRTLLFDIHRGMWDQELLRLFNIPASMLPEVKASTGSYGTVSTALGLGGVEIAGVAGDQQAALFGQACFRPGMAKCTYGTGAFLLQNVGTRARESRHRLLSTVAWLKDSQLEYAVEGSVFVAGSVVQWLRDGLGIIRQSSDVEALAQSVPDNGGIYLVPAFAGLGAPHWDPHARGTILGITRGTTAGHIARAALESIAFQVADLIEAVQLDSGVPMQELRVDGGAANNDSLMQVQADLLGIPVVRPSGTETTSLGAAYLAGLAVGFWSGTAEIERHWQVAKRFEPGPGAVRMQAAKQRWAQAVERSKKWVDATA